jgi:hypothetical protein
MKKSTSLLRSLAVPGIVAVATLGLATASLAAGSHDTKDGKTAKPMKAKEITCEQFLDLGTEVQPHVVYWLEGYSKAGKPEDAEIDVEELERPVTVVVTECRNTPKATVWEKIEKYF